jgi:flagellar M-ring protein FliF
MSQSVVPLNRNELTTMWNSLNASRKIGLGALVVVALTGLFFFIIWAQTPDYAVAFTDLESEDAAAIVEHLKENDITYQLSDGGGTIRVPSNQVHEVRLSAASQGLPGKGTVGFELFDTASLGMTDFTQQVNYQRALEGELARTIGSLTAVRSARVHIVIPQPTLFSEEEKSTTASVVVDLETGQQLSREQVRAISHLVASAVEGLTPENLTIVDMDGNVLADGTLGEATAPVALSASQIEAQRSLERDLELRIESMLENVLGPDRAIVRVSAAMDWDQVETESETYVPAEQGSVVRSSHQVSESYAGDAASAGGIPGASSNIPDAAPSYQTAITGTNASGYVRTDVITNYEVSRSVSRTVGAMGQVQRLSVSVLVDTVTDTLTLDAIQQASIAAAGIDATRGDVLSIKSVAFDRSFYADQASSMEEVQQREFYLQLAQWGAVAIVLIALLFVVRRLQRGLRTPRSKTLAVWEDSKGQEPDRRMMLLDEIMRGGGDLDALSAAEGRMLDLKPIGPPTFDADQQAAAEKAQMLRQLQLMAKTRPETLAQIIQFWLTEDEREN